MLYEVITFPPGAAIPVVTGILLQQTVAALAGVGLIQKLDNRGHGANRITSYNVCYTKLLRGQWS